MLNSAVIKATMHRAFSSAVHLHDVISRPYPQRFSLRISGILIVTGSPGDFYVQVEKNKLQQTKSQQNSSGDIILRKSSKVWWSRYSYPYLKRESGEAEGSRQCSRARVKIGLSYSESVARSFFYIRVFWLQISFYSCLPVFSTIKKPDVSIFFKRS